MDCDIQSYDQIQLANNTAEIVANRDVPKLFKATSTTQLLTYRKIQRIPDQQITQLKQQPSYSKLPLRLMELLSKLQRIPAQWWKTTLQMQISSTLFVMLTTFSGSSLLTYKYGTRGVTKIIRAKGRRRSRCDRKSDPGLYRSGGIGSASGAESIRRIARPRINFTS